jgi:hypothetical protein
MGKFYRISFLLVIIFSNLSMLSTLAQEIIINEIMAANNSTIADEDGDFEDWIELFNRGDQGVNLLGYGLSDDYERPFRWVFPELMLMPGEYLLVWASGKDKTSVNSPLHTNFSISSSGEEIVLTSPGGIRADHLPPVSIPADISIGRMTGGDDGFVFFTEPTPGYANSEDGFAGILDPPVFSVPSGYYQENQSIEITHSDQNAEIRYTFDNSIPDHLATLYDSPLTLVSLAGTPDMYSVIRTNPPDVKEAIDWKPPVTETDKARIIRAVATKPGYITSSAVTATYFTGHEVPSLPVFSIVTESRNLFDHHEGIYVPGIVYEQNGYGEGWYGQPNANYYLRGADWEKPAFIEFFENGSPVISQEVGIRIHGGGTRALPMKSLRLYARDSYGDPYLDYPFFPAQGSQKYKRLILRNSGQDQFGYGTLLRDGIIHRIAEPLGWPVQDQRPSIVFLNGEYWGIHNIRERYDEDYFSRKYNIQEKDLDFLESNQRVRNGSAEHYSNMISFIENNPLSDPGSYLHLQSLMDIDNYIDYFIINIFFNNIDWPGHNLKYWRYNGEPLNNPPPGKDGRWRWAFNDFDFGFGNTEGAYPYNENTLVHATHPDGTDWPPNQPWSTFLIRSLLENQDFRNDFINRFSDLLNSIFLPEHINGLLEEVKSAIEPEIARHINRWSYPVSSVAGWEDNIARMKRYADRRPDHQTNHLLNYFELSGTYQLTINVEEPHTGSVVVNKLSLKGDGLVPASDNGIYPWTGKYFMNVPLSIKAVAEPGFEFVRWLSSTGEIYEANPLVIDTGEDMYLTAEFGIRKTFFPEPFEIKGNDYFLFNRWDPLAGTGTFPDHMAFVYMDAFDPGADARPAGFTSGSYNLESRSRINGLDCGGVSFLNTGNEDGNPGYPGGRVGGAILALDTRGVGNVHILYQAGTISRNSRIYNLKLQYRLDDNSEFIDFPGAIVYEPLEDGHSVNSGLVKIPDNLIEQPYLQLLWRYYFTGIQEDENSGQRSELRIGYISVFEGDIFPDQELKAEVFIDEPEGVICSNDNLTLTAVNSNHSSTTVYSWYVDNMKAESGNDISFLLSGPKDKSSIRVIADDIESCLINLPASSNVIVIDVKPSPETPSVITGDTSLISSSLHGNQWYRDGVIIPGATIQEFVPVQSGSYYVIVSDEFCHSEPSGPVTFQITSGELPSDKPDDKPVIYPNPVGSTLVIKPGKASSAGGGKWSLFDYSGRTAGTGLYFKGQQRMEIDVANLAPGIYLLKLTSSGTDYLIRFVKE